MTDICVFCFMLFNDLHFFQDVKTTDSVVKNKPFPKRQILDSPKLKKFADDNFGFDENGRKFSTRVENNIGKGETAGYK